MEESLSLNTLAFEFQTGLKTFYFSQTDTNATNKLIDKVYQFSLIYCKSIKQQNLPFTIKYPEMVAQIAPHFNIGNIPANIGNDNLWFL